jgi:hypothetical protein
MMCNIYLSRLEFDSGVPGKPAQCRDAVMSFPNVLLTSTEKYLLVARYQFALSAIQSVRFMYQSFIRFIYPLLLAFEPRPLLFCVVVTMEAYRLIIGSGVRGPTLTLGH